MLRYLTRLALLAAIVGLSAETVRGDIIWENEGFTPDQGITSGTNLSGAIINTLVFSDSDGGTFDLNPGRNATYFTYKAATSGNHFGYFEMSFDNQNDDPADYLEINLTFDAPATNLQFSLVDVDRGPGNSFADGVELYYNGINVRSSPSFYSLGSGVGIDNEGYMTGFEGLGPAGPTETSGNIDLNFGLTEVNSLTIRYLSSNDAQSDPVAQFIGIGDLTFDSPLPPTSAPEPSAFLVLSAMLLSWHGLRRYL